MSSSVSFFRFFCLVWHECSRVRASFQKNTASALHFPLDGTRQVNDHDKALPAKAVSVLIEITEGSLSEREYRQPGVSTSVTCVCPTSAGVGVQNTIMVCVACVCLHGARESISCEWEVAWARTQAVTSFFLSTSCHRHIFCSSHVALEKFRLFRGLLSSLSSSSTSSSSSSSSPVAFLLSFMFLSLPHCKYV